MKDIRVASCLIVLVCAGCSADETTEAPVQSEQSASGGALSDGGGQRSLSAGQTGNIIAAGGLRAEGAGQALSAGTDGGGHRAVTAGVAREAAGAVSGGHIAGTQGQGGQVGGGEAPSMGAGEPVSAGVSVDVGGRLGGGATAVDLRGGSNIGSPHAGDDTGGILSGGTSSVGGAAGEVMNGGGDQAGAESMAGQPMAGHIGLSACEPALSARALPRAARPFDLVRIDANGGTGAWRFELVENRSGALLNHVTGAYLAGTTVGVVDRIRVTDDNCAGEATVELPVVRGLQVKPNAPQVPVLAQFRFEVQEGSGEFEFEMLRSESGASVSPDGVYEAGNLVGRDTVRIRDRETNEVIDISVQVDENVQITPEVEQLILPVGSEKQLEIRGGSGSFDVQFEGDGLDYLDGRLYARRAGRYDLQVTDRFLGGQSTQLTIDVTGSLVGDMAPMNDLSTAMRLYNPGDLNDDGVDDLVIGHNTADMTAGDGGAVFIFHSGLGNVPQLVQTIGGGTANEDFGRSVVFADFNGDTLVDMAVGARLADPGFNDAGQVQVHFGQPDGLFSESPAQVLSGIRAGDQLGFAVTACDFNGDGRQDIAASAQYYEVLADRPASNSQGAVFIFLGYEDGFLATPDQIVVGQRLNDDGSWSPYRDLILGVDIASGDMNGDGFCDLVASSTSYDLPGESNIGGVFIYPGLPPDALSPGGVLPQPALAYVGERIDNGGNLGRRIAMANFNGDAYVDLVVGEHTGDHPPIDAADQNAPFRDIGHVYLIPGSDFSVTSATTLVRTSTLPHRYSGDSTYDNFGIGMTGGDYNGDGVIDLIVGAYADDPPGRSNAGKLVFFRGVEGQFPSTTPTEKWAGNERNARLGESMVVVGDFDASGLPDIVVHASRSSVQHLDLGQTYVIRPKVEADLDGDDELAAEDSVLTSISVPQRAGFSRFGQSVSLVPSPVAGGPASAFVAAPYGTETAARSGKMWQFLPDEDGVFQLDGTSVGSFRGLSTSDYLWWIRPVGDFDNDGLEDIAVLLRSDERVSSGTLNGNQYLVDGANPPSRSDSGGLYVFRGAADNTYESQPSFVFWGQFSSLSPEVLAGAGDFNGDGFDDIVLGAFRGDNPDVANDTGLVRIITGRSYVGAGATQVIKDPHTLYYGTNGGGQLSRSVTSIGDIDADGCDDIAAGGPYEDTNGRNNQGGVTILYGWGGQGCQSELHIARLVTEETNSTAGFSIAANDFDNDGLHELIIGAPNRRTDNVSVGGVWVVPGSFLNTLNPQLPSVAEAAAPTRMNTQGLQWLVAGQTAGSNFGTRVAAAGQFMAVGAMFESVDEQARVGRVNVYRVDQNGIRPAPVASLIGESWRPESRLGEDLYGALIDGVATFIAGAPRGNGAHPPGVADAASQPIDNGSAYIFSVTGDSP